MLETNRASTPMEPELTSDHTGPAGGMWDLDTDGVPDYFWPGSLEDAPKGFQSDNYDADDSNSADR